MMRTNNIFHNESKVKSINTTDQEALILQASIVKQDIDQLLMHLGANHDKNTIARKMDQLGRNIAELYTYIHNATSAA